MNKVQEALKKALARFQMIDQGQAVFVRDAIDELKSALSDIENCEPVALVHRTLSGQITLVKPDFSYFDISNFIGATFYTSPISKEWVGLSDQQIQNLIINSDNYNKFQFIKSVEHTVKQLNTSEKG
jgi:hypothetical protein